VPADWGRLYEIRTREVLELVARGLPQRVKAMLEIKKRYVVDEQDRRVAVQIDLETFARIEEVLEDFALARLITEGQEEPALDPEAAQEYYNSLDKAS
jgi:class 3 adenylate cyclase